MCTADVTLIDYYSLIPIVFAVGIFFVDLCECQRLNYAANKKIPPPETGGGTLN